MGFSEVSSLDADVTIAIGKVDKKTGKAYPKQAEGYYLGSRTVESKRGSSKLHFLQTAKGNIGVWGTTDLSRKLSQVKAGTMVRITSTGTKPTPNGDMYTYRVEADKSNTIEVAGAEDTLVSGYEASDLEVGADDEQTSGTYEDEDAAQAVALAAAERKAKVENLIKNRRTGN